MRELSREEMMRVQGGFTPAETVALIILFFTLVLLGTSFGGEPQPSPSPSPSPSPPPSSGDGFCFDDDGDGFCDF